jgi:hypothetical protein
MTPDAPLAQFARALGERLARLRRACGLTLRVAFDDHDVVRLSSEEVGGVLALGVQSVGGDHDSGQVCDGVEQRLEASDLVGLLRFSCRGVVVLSWRQDESGLGDEAVQEGGAVLHPLGAALMRGAVDQAARASWSW